MLSDLIDVNSLARIRDENLSDHVSGLIGQKVWQIIISVQNLLVEVRSFLILVGEISTEHGVEDYTTTPEVAHETVVPLSSNHLWGCIARTTAGCFECIALLVEVTQAEVNNFKTLIVIDKKILGLQIPMTNAKLMDIVDA